MLALALFAAACTRLPWKDEPIRSEVNLSFTLERNLIQLTTARIDNRAGRFILGTATPRTVIDPDFPLSSFRRHSIQISEKETLRLSPVRLDLGGIADAIVGVEPWTDRAVSIDFHSGLVTYQKQGIFPGYMKLYTFTAEPMINALVDGQQVSAIVDTSIPDTLILPAATQSRGTVRVAIADTDFGPIDVQFANVPQARVGNRLLSRFLVTIDYGKRMVGLWRDPRNEM